MSNWTDTPIRVRYQETDQMGVVYHSNYFVWFEVGRVEHMRHNGIDYRKLEDDGLYLPVIDVHCRYYKPALYDDICSVRASVAKFDGLRLVFAYEVRRSGEVLVTGTTEHVFMKKNGKPVRLAKTHPVAAEQVSRLVYTGAFAGEKM